MKTPTTSRATSGRAPRWMRVTLAATAALVAGAKGHAGVFTGNLAADNWQGSIVPDDQPLGITANYTWLGSGEIQRLLITGPTVSHPGDGSPYFTTVEMKPGVGVGATATRSFPYIFHAGQNDGPAMAYVYRVEQNDISYLAGSVQVAPGNTINGMFVVTGLAPTDRIAFVLESDLVAGKFDPATLELVPEPGAFVPGMILLGWGVWRFARRRASGGS